MPNAELAWKAYDEAMAHRQALNMSSWLDGEHHIDGQGPVTIDDLKRECGTTACFAGWTVALSGYAMDDRDPETYAYQNDVPVGTVPDVARELLSIDEFDENLLFYCDEEELEERIVEVFGPRPAAANESADGQEGSQTNG